MIISHNQSSFPAITGLKNKIGKSKASSNRLGIRYKSGKFFETLKNQAIADEIEFQIEIVAKK